MSKSPTTKSNHKEWIKKLKEEKGLPVAKPDTGKEAEDDPELLPIYAWIWNEFWVLSGQRVYSQIGPHPLSLSDIYAYFKIINKYNHHEQSFLLTCFIAMDAVYLEVINKQIQDDSNK